jgi:membrane associated rhomboid family serine protease
MFFPYSTDAPVYYWPITTVSLIVVNVIVFCLELAAPETMGHFALVFGEGLNPVQWITCNFMHGGFMHLAGNMLFLWSFGLIVEGKLGWYKTLAIYLGIGTLYGAIVQVLMLGSHGAALGASAAIFGFMAMSLVWAPENDMQCVFLLVFYPIYFEMRVFVLVGLFLVLQVATVLLTGMAMNSAVLHLVGAALGFPVAIWMLKKGLVDCENWDLFSVWAGRHTMTARQHAEAEAADPGWRQRHEERLRARREKALEEIRRILQSGQPKLALAANQRLSHELPGWRLPEPDLLALIRALRLEKLWVESIPAMVEYLSHYSEKAVAIRLELARVLVAHQSRGVQAMKVLAKIDPSALDARQRQLFEACRARARQLHEADPYEVASEGV